MPDCFSYFTAGRKQFARHEWAQKAAYLLGCSLEELSSAIFKHQLKGGTLQRSTSFRQGPEESGLGDGTGTQKPWAGGVSGRTHHLSGEQVLPGGLRGCPRPRDLCGSGPRQVGNREGRPREQETELVSPCRPQAERTRMLRGHGVWSLQRALYPSHLLDQ